MLPSYVLYQLKGEEGSASATRRAWRGFVIAVMVTAGFVVVFGLVGSIISLGGRWLLSAFPYLGLLIGIGMVVLGIWILATNRTLSILGGGPVATNRERSLRNAFVFGTAYAAGSLSCTLPIFLVVVGTSLTGGELLSSFGQFLGYALGMGTIIFGVTIGAALFRRAMTRWLRLMAPYVHRLGALFLVGAGLYLVYYWVFQAGLS